MIAVNCLCPELSKFHDKQLYGRQFAESTISKVPIPALHMPETQWLKTVVKLSLMSKMVECLQPMAETFIKYANFVHTILWDKDNYPSTLIKCNARTTV